VARLGAGTGTVAVRVVTRTGATRVSRSAEVTYLGAPLVSRSVLVRRPAGNTVEVVLLGRGLSGTSAVTLNGKATPFTVASDVALVVTTPLRRVAAVKVTSACPGGVAPPAATSCGTSAVKSLRV